MSMNSFRSKKNWVWFFLGFCIVCIIYIIITDPKAQLSANTDNPPQIVESQEKNAPEITTPDAKNADNYYAAYRLERENVRSRQLELLQSICDDEKTDAESRKDALEQIIAINNSLGQELQLEKLITAKTNQPSAVFIQNEKVTVVVDAADIDKEMAIQIGDMVKSVTGLSLDKVVVVPRQTATAQK